MRMQAAGEGGEMAGMLRQEVPFRRVLGKRRMCIRWVPTNENVGDHAHPLTGSGS